MRYMCWILLLCIIPFQATSRVLDPEQDPDITPFLRPIELTTEGITHFWACYHTTLSIAWCSRAQVLT